LRERGAALMLSMMAIMALLLISGISLSLVMSKYRLETSEEKILKAYAIAEAGINRQVSVVLQAVEEARKNGIDVNVIVSIPRYPGEPDYENYIAAKELRDKLMNLKRPDVLNWPETLQTPIYNHLFNQDFGVYTYRFQENIEYNSFTGTYTISGESGIDYYQDSQPVNDLPVNPVYVEPNFKNVIITCKGVYQNVSRTLTQQYAIPEG
jgi:hypothetical protein